MGNSGISAKQKAAIRALLTGSSYPEAAQVAKVHENTIGMWMKDPAFLDALHVAEGEAMAAITRALVAVAEKSTGVLSSVMDNTQARDSSRVRAADVALARLMQVRELNEFEERIKRLEEMIARGQNE